MKPLQDNRGAADPRPLMALSTAYWDSQTFLTANRIGLFDALARESLSVEQVAAALGTRPRPTRLFLNACAALGLVVEDGGRYANTAVSEAFLVSHSPTFMGHAFRYSDDLYATWGQLEDALKEDRPVLRAQAYLGDDPDRTRHFVYGMHSRALGIGQALVTLVDLEGRRKMLDVGGGPGTYSMLFTRRFPALRATVLELPGVAAITEEILAENGAAEQVTVIPGDYHETPFPDGNDVVLISGVFHRETEENCQRLIAKACDALLPGGLLVVSDVFTDQDGLGTRFATLFGLNMLLTAPDGGVHADTAAQGWMAQAGCRDISIESFPPPMPHRLIVGTKSA